MQSVCGDFWRNSIEDGRREILECAAFPLFPSTLTNLLRAVSGSGRSNDESIPSQSLFDLTAENSAQESLDYFTHLSEITLLLQEPSESFSRELKGQTVVITLENDLHLPSGQTLPAKSQGVLVSRSGEEVMAVKWAVELSGWPILFSLMAAAIEGPQGSKSAEWSKFVDTSDLVGVLSGGMAMVKSILVSDSSCISQLVHSPDLAASNNKAPGTSLDFLSILFGLTNPVAIARNEVRWKEAVANAMSTISILIPHYPNRIWSEIRAAGFFAFARQDFCTIKTIIERDTHVGEFSSTVSALNLVVKLAENVQRGQFQNDLQTIYNRSNSMAHMIQFLFHTVWTRFQGWRYISPRQKADISTALCSIFTSVLRNPTSTLHLSRPDLQEPLHALNTVVYNLLVRASSDFDLSPLLNLITAPMYGTFGSRNRLVDRAPLERALCSGLRLAFYIAVANNATGVDSDNGILAIVTRTLSDRGGETDSLHVVEAVFDIAMSPYLEDETAISAMEFLQMLMIEAKSAQSTFSFMACLKSPKTTSEQFVDMLAKGARSPEVQDMAWQTLRIMAEAQPALTRFCFKIDGEGERQAERSIALHVAFKSIAQWEKLVGENPRLLSRAVGLLQDLYDYHPDLVEILNVAEDAALWKAIGDFATLIQPSVDSISHSQTLMQDDEEGQGKITAYVGRCFSRSAKASVLELLHTILDRATASRDAKLFERTDVKTALNLLKSGKPFADMMADSTVSSFDPELRAREAGRIYTVLTPRYLELLQNRLPMFMRTFGDSYLFSEYSRALYPWSLTHSRCFF